MREFAASKTSLLIDAPDIRKASSIYRALYHPVRLKLVQILDRAGFMDAKSLQRKLKIEQTLIFQHLRILIHAGLVCVQKEGKHTFYAINYQRTKRIIRLTDMLAKFSAFESDKVRDALTASFFNHPNNNETIRFTEKELSIIRLICDQKQNNEIAKELKLSKRTVEGYRESILKKMKVKNTAGLVVYAIATGIYIITVPKSNR